VARRLGLPRQQVGHHLRELERAVRRAARGFLIGPAPPGRLGTAAKQRLVQRADELARGLARPAARYHDETCAGGAGSGRRSRRDGGAGVAGPEHRRRIASWFAPITRATPGVGGSVFVRWGRRAEEAPPSVVDHFLQGAGGSTVLRLVHSGFGPESSFDDEYDSTGSAWPIFLTMLKHSVELGIGGCRNVTVFRMLEVRNASSQTRRALLRSSARSICCLEFPGPADAMLRVFRENAGGQAMLTPAWLLCGADEAGAEAVRQQWTGFVDRLLATGAAAR